MAFDLETYTWLVGRLKQLPRDWLLFDEVQEAKNGAIGLLRHDVDYDLVLASQLARVNQAAGISATFFVQVSSPFLNLFSRDNVKRLDDIQNAGQSIGLHYCPTGGEDEKERLLAEYRVLLQAVPNAIPVVTGHNAMGLFESVNRAAKKLGLPSASDKPFFSDGCFISDSNMSRSARQITADAAACQGKVLQVLLHPIVWSWGKPNMESVLANFVDRANRNMAEALDVENRIWSAKIYPMLKPWLDQETGRSIEFVDLDRHYCQRNSEIVLELVNQDERMEWTIDNLMMDLPGKWELSFGAMENGRLGGVCFSSIRENCFYMHAWVVERRTRGTGWGWAMLEKAEKIAKSKDLRAIRFRTYIQKKRALSFFLKAGFVFVDVSEKYHELILEKDLS